MLVVDIVAHVVVVVASLARATTDAV